MRLSVGVAKQLAFKELKSGPMAGPILSHFNPNSVVIIHTDASMVGLRAVLTQKHERVEQVFAYASRASNKAGKNYGATHLKLLAVVLGSKNLNHKLLAIGSLKLLRIVPQSSLSCVLKT